MEWVRAMAKKLLVWRRYLRVKIFFRRFIKRSDGEVDNDGKPAFHFHITVVYGTVDTPLQCGIIILDYHILLDRGHLPWDNGHPPFQCGIIILDYHIVLDRGPLAPLFQNEGNSWDEQRLGPLTKSFVSDLAVILDD
nr:hypothetical protein CFP56_57454 [Quercus suber]